MKLENCCYDKIKLLHELSCMAWFIEKHAQPEALKKKDADYHKILTKLHKDLLPYIEELKVATCKNLTKEK